MEENQTRFAAILSLLESKGMQGEGTMQIAEATKLTLKTTRDYMTQLQRAGRVSRKGRFKDTRWFLTSAGNLWIVPELPREFFHPRH